MPRFGKRSQERLALASPLLQTLFEAVVLEYDCSILVSYRGRAEQDAAFRSGRSEKPWPESKHNHQPSLAIDVAPYPIEWDNSERFYHFAGYVQGTAQRLGIGIRWGGDWDGDFNLSDQTLYDLVHFELE